MKEQNISWLREHPHFTFYKANLLTADLDSLLKESLGETARPPNELTDRPLTIFHLAAQAGVRTSWGENFKIYIDNNVRATQRLLEWAKYRNIKKLIYASSSSVYGDITDLPIKENSPLRPISPYGVTKLAGEHLCYLYWKSFGIPIIALRYFSVYGPRQRPDMAFYRFIRALLEGERIAVYGDGEQMRDFTFVKDAVEASILAMNADVAGEVLNIGSSSAITVNKVIQILEGIIGTRSIVKYIEKQMGDMRHTAADISKARDILGYTPKTNIKDGLREEVDWLISSYKNIRSKTQTGDTLGKCS